MITVHLRHEGVVSAIYDDLFFQTTQIMKEFTSLESVDWREREREGERGEGEREGGISDMIT